MLVIIFLMPYRNVKEFGRIVWLQVARHSDVAFGQHATVLSLAVVNASSAPSLFITATF